MRKIDPADVRNAYRAEIDELLAYMDRTQQAIEDASSSMEDISLLAAMVFLSLYVGFERFLSDLFLAYLNRDFSKYQDELATRILQSTEEKVGPWAKSRTRFDTIQHVKVDDLEAIVDPNSWNLTFKDAADIRTKANRWLAPPHRARISSMSVHDERLIDTARAVRDFIAHQSPGAKTRMNQLLRTVAQGPQNQHLDRGANEVHNVGSYLKSVFAGRRRLEIYADRLKAIAAKL